MRQALCVMQITHTPFQAAFNVSSQRGNTLLCLWLGPTPSPGAWWYSEDFLRRACHLHYFKILYTCITLTGSRSSSSVRLFESRPVLLGKLKAILLQNDPVALMCGPLLFSLHDTWCAATVQYTTIYKRANTHAYDSLVVQSFHPGLSDYIIYIWGNFKADPLYFSVFFCQHCLGAFCSFAPVVRSFRTLCHHILVTIVRLIILEGKRFFPFES